MLISLTLENWMSFRQPVSFSMIATKERQHSERIPKIAKYNIRVLPIAAIYGGNASGKTNLFKALSFAKSLVLSGTSPGSLISVEPFRLDAESMESPTRFAFQILAKGMIFEFSFSVTRKAVVEEKLVRITPSSEKTLYHRRDGQPNFDASLSRNEFLKFAFQGTRDNQLFLTNSVSQKVDEFRDVYDWFDDSLELVAPDERFASFGLFLNEEDPLYLKMNEMLRQLDTGISRMGSEAIPIESIGLPPKLQAQLQTDVNEDTAMAVMHGGPMKEYLVFTRDDGHLVAKKLFTYHAGPNRPEVRFELHHESDGSERLINLLPALLDLSREKSRKVYVIDEIDRSLHTLLTKQLLEMYLSGCSSESRAQLLMTTHDVLLMGQDLFRRDEMWVTERDGIGITSLYPFSDFKDVRYDKDIRKSYLQGRLGGIPRILLGGALSDSCSAQESEGDD